jgi:hypothetical protein
MRAVVEQSSFPKIPSARLARSSARKPNAHSIEHPWVPFRFDVFGDDRQALGVREALHRRALRLDAEAGALLLPCGDTVVGNSRFHTNCTPPFAVWMKLEGEQ